MRRNVEVWKSLPAWERGLKPYLAKIEEKKLRKSLPAWERGLKRRFHTCDRAAAPSLPAWERGLKRRRAVEQGKRVIVAPRVGAWIETDVAG